MYKEKDARQFENLIRTLSASGVVDQEICDTAIAAVFRRLEGHEDEDVLLSRADAARILKCSVKTVDRLCSEGKLTRIHSSKRAVRIRLSDLKQMIGI